ncbi:MAG: hypothetical protein HQL32_14105, partial [Planctomycetes bacterium]|nr:hypothetical protein [Planctomycetota bacterium]
MRRQPLQVLWLFVGIGIFLGARHFQANMVQSRETHDLNIMGKKAEAPPPEVSFALSMGIFRSMIIDALWMRAVKLQEEKRFYEIVHLYDLIGKLQPYDEKVWSYAAWNMSYNISVTFPAGEERWRWVQNGMNRLKFHGIPYNPNGGLYSDLAHMYSHKYSKNLDDSHLLYKTRFAEQVQGVMGEFHNSAGNILKALNQNEDEALRKKALKAKEELTSELAMDLTEMGKMEED